MKATSKAEPKTTSAAPFCVSLAWPKALPIEWYDRTGIHKLDEHRRVQIRLVTRGVADQYEGFEVEVIHKLSGPIAKEYFAFDSYCSKERARDVRCDGRGHDSPLPPVGRLHAYPNTIHGFQWHILAPKTEAFCGAILDYVRGWA